MATNGQSATTAEVKPEIKPLAGTENFVPGMKRPGGRPPHFWPKKKKKTTEIDFTKNAVQLLNELKHGLDYQVTDQSGPVHQPSFTIQVVIDGNAYTGTGSSKKIAKLSCAQVALEALGHTPGAAATADTPAASTPTTTQAQSVQQGKNPLVILNEIWPGLNYQTVSEAGDMKSRVYTMSITVGQETFQGEGNSKRQAKAKAAQEALQKLYNLQFTTTPGGDPVFQGTEADYAQYKPAKIAQQYAAAFEGDKNPVAELNELYTGLNYSIEQHEDKSMTCAIEIENQRFEALGLNKKAVKLQVAVEAIRWLHESGLYAQRTQEILERRAQRKGNTKHYAAQHRARQAGGQQYGGQQYGGQQHIAFQSSGFQRAGFQI